MNARNQNNRTGNDDSGPHPSLDARLDAVAPQMLREMDQRLDLSVERLRQAQPAPQAAWVAQPWMRVAAAIALLALAGTLWTVFSGNEAKESRNVASRKAEGPGLSGEGGGDYHQRSARLLASGAQLIRDGRSRPLAGAGSVELLAADALTVGPEGAARVTFPDGSTADYSAGSHFVLSYTETGTPIFELAEGVGTYSVRKQSTGLQVITPLANVVVVGTEFTVEHDRWVRRTGQPRTAVRVTEGEVHVSSHERSVSHAITPGVEAVLVQQSFRLMQLAQRESDAVSAVAADVVAAPVHEDRVELFSGSPEFDDVTADEPGVDASSRRPSPRRPSPPRPEQLDLPSGNGESDASDKQR